MKKSIHMTLGRISRIAALLGACAVVPVPAQAQDTPSLPSGASSLQETFGDWRVTCQVSESTKRCALSQQQAQQNGERMLAIELVPGSNNTMTGTLVLPFGLLLDAGVALQVDEQVALASIQFHTCIPAGCVVLLTLNAATTTALRNGETLNVAVKAADSQQEIQLKISLSGLPAALDRLSVLLEG